MKRIGLVLLTYFVCATIASAQQDLTKVLCRTIGLGIQGGKSMNNRLIKKKLNAPFTILRSEGLLLKDKGNIIVCVLDHEFPTTNNGVSFWKLVDSSFYDSKKMISTKSGLYMKKGNPLYFIKVKFIANEDTVGIKPIFRLLFFYNLKGKILYGLYDSSDSNLEKWENTSTNLLESIILL